MGRKNSIFKIIIWSIIAVLLIFILIVGIKFGSIDFFSFNFGDNCCLNSYTYSSENNEVDASDISDIEINWIDGSINVESYDGDKIKFYEKSRNELDDSDLLHYSNSGNKLTIDYCASKRFPIFMRGFNLNKSLTVQIPKSMTDQLIDFKVKSVTSDIGINNIDSKYIDIENLSGKISLDGITAYEINIDTTSGDIYSDNTIVKKTTDINTISGNTVLDGSIPSINFNSVSGYLKIFSDVCPNKVDTNTTSGNITLKIPDNDGFTYSYDGVSGELKCDFPINERNGEGVYGNGQSNFSFDTISGDVYIS